MLASPVKPVCAETRRCLVRFGLLAAVLVTPVAPAPAVHGQTADLGDSRFEKPRIAFIDPPEKDFFSKRLDFHGIPIKAHEVVADEALYAAHRRLSLLFTNLLVRQPMVLTNLVASGAELHIIGRDQVTTDLPEWRHHKGKPVAEYNGLTRDERTRGMGLAKTKSEEVIISGQTASGTLVRGELGAT